MAVETDQARTGPGGTGDGSVDREVNLGDEKDASEAASEELVELQVPADPISVVRSQARRCCQLTRLPERESTAATPRAVFVNTSLYLGGCPLSVPTWHLL